MNRSAKTLICLAAVCLVVGRSSTFAQFRFNKGGSSRNSTSQSSSSSRNSKGSSSSRLSGGGSVRKTTNSNNHRWGSFGSNSSKSGTSNVSRSSDARGTHNAGTMTKSQSTNHRQSPLNSLLRKPVLNSNGTQPGTKGKLSTMNNHDVIKSRQQDKGRKLSGTLSRFVGNGSNGSQNSGGNSNQNKTEQKHDFWKDGVRNLVKSRFAQGHWCHSRPTACHWWADYCQPIAHCHHQEVVVCDWNRVHCSATLHVGQPPQDVQWYLGLKGILLPGKGIGIDTVEAGSPAEAVGLQPGMVMTACNGISLVDEGSLQEAIRISGGVLQMTLLSADGTQVLQGTVQMTQIASVSF